MNHRITTILVLALVLAAAASYVVYRLLMGRVANPPRASAGQVLVAARQLEIGSLVRELDLKTGDWTGALPKGMVTRKEQAVGRGVIAPIYEGEPLMENRLAAPGAGGGLAATIPPGMRACAVKVNEIVGVAGFVVPGMRVDVLISGSPPGSPNQAGSRVRTLLQNIEVLSAGQNYQKDAEGKPVLVPVVNLLVTPEQAEVLSLASNETRIQLVLRNPLDTQVAKTRGLSSANLFGEPAAAAPRPLVARAPKIVAPVAAPPPPPYQVEVFNGPRRSDVKFPRSAEEIP